VPYQFGTNAIAVGSVTAERIAANAILAGKIAAGAVTADKIVAGAITADKIAAGIIVAGIINGTIVSAATFIGSVFEGTDFIINSTGSFFYTGTPAVGNPPVQWETNGALTDPFGNALPGTAGSIGSIGGSGSWQAFTSSAAFLQWYQAASKTGPWTNGASIVAGNNLDGDLDISTNTATVMDVYLGNGKILIRAPALIGTLTGVSFTPGTGLVAQINQVDETWHALGTAGSTGCTLNQGRYRLTADGETEIDIALTAGAGGSTAGTYTWSNTLPSGYQFTGNFSRAYNMGYVDPITAGVENPAIVVDGAGTGAPGRVRMFLPAFGAGTLFTVTVRIPTN
jgi:hypothetical protein